MREIRTSGLMSGEGKRVAQAIPRLSSTLPLHTPNHSDSADTVGKMLMMTVGYARQVNRKTKQE
jgi:hypothetical protein